MAKKAIAGIAVAARQNIVSPTGSCALPKSCQIKPREARYSVTISATSMTPGSQGVSGPNWRDAASSSNAPTEVVAQVPTMRQIVS